MSKNNIEILTSFLSADTSVLESSNAEISQNISSVLDAYLDEETDDSFNKRIEVIFMEDNSHAEYLRDLIADAYFKEDTNEAVKSKIVSLSNSNSLLKNELEFRTDIKKLYLIENRPAFKKKLQDLTEPVLADVAAANTNVSPAASTGSNVSFLKPLAIAASVLLVVVIGYFIFRDPQQTQIAKVDTKKNTDSIAVPEYKKMIIITLGKQNGIGFASDGQSAITDSLVIGVLIDSINAYKLWNDTLVIKSSSKVDSVKVIRRVSNESDKIYLKLNADEYQIMESDEYLRLELSK